MITLKKKPVEHFIARSVVEDKRAYVLHTGRLFPVHKLYTGSEGTIYAVTLTGTFVVTELYEVVSWEYGELGDG